MKLLTISEDAPSDFPADDYNYVHAKLQPFGKSNPAEFLGYGGGWNAVAYRFIQMADGDEDFRAALPTDQRYLQEKALFGFFVAGLSVLESFCYALHFAASVVDSSAFPTTTEGALKSISPGTTAKRLQQSFPKATVGLVLGTKVNSPELAEWRELRNALAHREAPGRKISAQLTDPITISDSGDSPAPTGTQVVRSPDIWNLKSLKVDDALTIDRRAWLANALTDLVASAREFVDDQFS